MVVTWVHLPSIPRCHPFPSPPSQSLWNASTTIMFITFTDSWTETSTNQASPLSAGALGHTGADGGPSRRALWQVARLMFIRALPYLSVLRTAISCAWMFPGASCLQAAHWSQQKDHHPGRWWEHAPISTAWDQISEKQLTFWRKLKIPPVIFLTALIPLRGTIKVKFSPLGSQLLQESKRVKSELMKFYNKAEHT